MGKPSEISGKYALQSLNSATEALKNGDVDILVTAPIDNSNPLPTTKFTFPLLAHQ